MQLTVFGASGKVGSLVVKIALRRGYKVVAFIHSNNPFDEVGNFSIIQGEISDKQAVNKAIEGSNAVISALGSWGTKEKNILTAGMKTIIPAMESAKISRLITLTGSGAMWSMDNSSFFDKSAHKLLGIVAPKILKDGEEHLRILEASDLDWTCVRSPVMNKSISTDYKLDYIPPLLIAQVSRSTVAKCLIDQIKNSNYLRKAPHIHKA